MKTAVIFLIILGLLAAVSAAILVKTLTTAPVAQQGPQKQEDDVEIYVATRDLPPMTVIDAAAVHPKKVHRSQVTEHILTSASQIVGRVLTSNMVAGETFNKACFAPKAEGMYLAAVVPPGKRAMSVSLTDWSSMAGLLYPGCLVDVVVSLNPPATVEGRQSETICTTLLQDLQVLAIGSQSIAADKYTDIAPGAMAAKGQINFRMVTLLVDPRQAEVLQLAMEHGKLALAMRNPMDSTHHVPRITRIGELAALPGMGGYDPARPAVDATPKPAAPPTPAATKPADPLWETLIVRGTQMETRKFPLSATRAPATAPVSSVAEPDVPEKL